ncbi:uncharacterized protein LOC142318019 [Lycorma delicatula]|uniref:uncharacterized protein LOC142318019 n=1 Tax=Lycorma delicatula TaxID=130591 RepID=UPI003F50EC08
MLFVKVSLTGFFMSSQRVATELSMQKIDSVQLKEEELLEIMNNQNTSLTIEEFNLVKPENLKVENEVKSEISLNDDIPPRINLKINDVHTIKAEEEEEFYPGHQVDLLQLKEELLDIEKDHLAIEDSNLNKTENLEVKNEVKMNLEQLKEELDIMSSDNEKRSLSTEDTNLVKSENLKVENEMESEILLNDDVSPQVNPNMKSNELRIKDFHTVKTKDGMVFYPCRVIIDKLTITASTNNCKRCVNNSVYGGIIKQKTSECKCANCDLRTENLGKDISNENELPQHKGKKLVCEFCNERFRCKCYLKRHVNCHAKEKENNSNSCQKSLILENKLKTQLITHKEEKNYVCNFCQKSFNHKSNLKIHLNIHTKEKNYVCNFCQKSFNHKSSLKLHLNIHTKEKNFISKVAPVIDLSHIMIPNLYT